MSTIDGYIRVSSVRGRTGASYISPSEQRAAIERWAEYRNLTIGEWHIDEDQSGGTHQRPGLEAAILRATTGQTGGIACAKIDRFSRLSEHGLRDLRVLQEAGARLVFAMEDIDTSGPLGKLVYTVMLAQAEYFLEQIKAQWIAAKGRAVERGAYISRTPFGYQRQPDGRIVPHPEHADHVAHAYRLAVSGGPRAAAGYLNAHAPGRVWSTATVRRMLARVVYLGETQIGQFAGTTHDPLVSRQLWEAAQRAVDPRSSSDRFPLSGVVCCGTCGQPMVGGHGGQHSERRVYRCSATTGARTRGVAKCPGGAVIVADRLERYLREIAEEALGGMRAEISHPELDSLTILERALLDAEAELDQFAADMHLRRALGDRYHQHLDARVREVEKARAEYRSRARSAESRVALRAPDVLDRPGALAVVLRGMFSRIVVVRGRGLAVGDRVRLVPVDVDEPAGVFGFEELE